MQPTIGIDFMGKNITYKSTSCRLQLWDTAGQERFRSLIPSYLKDAICAVFVFDVSSTYTYITVDPASLDGITQWIELFRDNKN
jgi:Ras-related protein Rab-6A